MNPPSPALTIIMMMPNSFARLANGLACLRAQTVVARIEFVLVHARDHAAEIDPEQFRHFQSFCSVEMEKEFSPAAGFTAAFSVSTAPVICYLEDHVMINPEWAEQILEAHRGPWAGVSPAMENWNHEKSHIGYMNFLVCFSDWFGFRERSPVASGPGHNTSYKRAALEPYRDRLEELYESERNLGYLLEADGGKIVVEPRAITRHLNISKFSAAMSHAYCGGKLFAAHRAASMSLPEKILRSILFPLVPLVRGARLFRSLHERGKLTAGLLPILPSLILDFILHALGEVAGYWGDAHGIGEAYRRFEMDRSRYVTRRDRLLLFPAGHSPE